LSIAGTILHDPILLYVAGALYLFTLFTFLAIAVVTSRYTPTTGRLLDIFEYFKQGYSTFHMVSGIALNVVSGVTLAVCGVVSMHVFVTGIGLLLGLIGVICVNVIREEHEEQDYI
jgi:hypothetical protein